MEKRFFFEKEDRKHYLSLLKKYAAKWTSQAMAYCLMSNHIHLLTKLHTEESLYKMMQGHCNVSSVIRSDNY